MTKADLEQWRSEAKEDIEFERIDPGFRSVKNLHKQRVIALCDEVERLRNALSFESEVDAYIAREEAIMLGADDET